MVKLNTLNTIIDDILLEVRNNNIAESESLSRTQIEQWITHYRSMLIKQDIDKGRNINPDYIQDISNLEIELVVADTNSPVGFNYVTIRTVKEIPSTIDFHYEDGILSLTDQANNLIQMTTEKRARMNRWRRWTNRLHVAYEKGGRIYVYGNDNISLLNIRGVFDNPMDPMLSLSADDRYPMPANMIATMKELIISKEINIVSQADVYNDSMDETQKPTLSPNDYKKIQRGIK